MLERRYQRLDGTWINDVTRDLQSTGTHEERHMCQHFNWRIARDNGDDAMKYNVIYSNENN